MYYYRSPPNLNYNHLILEVITKQNSSLILTSECPANIASLLLKVGIKMNDLLKESKFQVIDLFTQNTLWQTEELPLTELAPKLWTESQAYQLDLQQFLITTVTHRVIIIENLSYFEIMCRERKQKSLRIIEELLMKCDKLYIFGTTLPLTPDEVALTNFLTKQAKVIVTIMSNQSGFSKDIDGQMIVETRENGGVCFEKQIYHLDQNKVDYLSALKMV